MEELNVEKKKEIKKRTPVSGKEFNAKNKGRQLYKLLRFTEIHNDFQYFTGRNDCPQKFDCSEDCSAGGLYLTDGKNLKMWLRLYRGVMYWLRRATIPDDALVYDEGKSIKVSAVILGERENYKYEWRGDGPIELEWWRCTTKIVDDEWRIVGQKVHKDFKYIPMEIQISKENTTNPTAEEEKMKEKKKTKKEEIQFEDL